MHCVLFTYSYLLDGIGLYIITVFLTIIQFAIVETDLFLLDILVFKMRLSVACDVFIRQGSPPSDDMSVLLQKDAGI